MSCETFNYSGAGQCKALLKTAVGVLIKERDTVLTKANAVTLAGIKGLVCPSTGCKGLFIDFRRGTEFAGGENELTTSNLGFTDLTDVSSIQMTAFANVGFGDYQILRNLAGREIEIGIVTKDGMLWGSNQNLTNYVGFSGKFFVGEGLEKSGADNQKQFPLYFYFEDLTEWGTKREYFKLGYTVAQAFRDINPIGLDLKIITDYAAGGNFTVQVNYRGEDRPYAGMTTADEWKVISAKADVGTTLTVVSAAEAALGKYVLNAVNGTPADMAGAFKIQAQKVVSTFITHITNVVEINA